MFLWNRRKQFSETCQKNIARKQEFFWAQRHKLPKKVYLKKISASKVLWTPRMQFFENLLKFLSRERKLVYALSKRKMDSKLSLLAHWPQVIKSKEKAKKNCFSFKGTSGQVEFNFYDLVKHLTKESRKWIRQQKYSSKVSTDIKNPVWTTLPKKLGQKAGTFSLRVQINEKTKLCRKNLSLQIGPMVTQKKNITNLTKIACQKAEIYSFLVLNLRKAYKLFKKLFSHANVPIDT